MVSRNIAGSVTNLEHMDVELTARKRAVHNMTSPPHRGKPTATTLLVGGSRSNTLACSYC